MRALDDMTTGMLLHGSAGHALMSSGAYIRRLSVSL
jgi:hypothetical protein